MKKFLLITTLMLLAFSYSLKGQSCLSQEAEWYYDASLFMHHAYVHIQYTKDTTIQDVDTSIECKVLEKTRHYVSSHTGAIEQRLLGYEYIYTTADVVGIYKHGAFYTLYNFAANVGDEWEVPYMYDVGEDCRTAKVQVIATGDTLISGEQLRYLELDYVDGYSWGIYGLVIERIGAVQHYMFPEQRCIADLFEANALRCFIGNNINISIHPTQDCDYLSIADKETLPSFSMYPNPVVRGNLHLDLPINKVFNMSITNSSGKEVIHAASISHKATIDLSALSPSCYFIHLQSGNTVFTDKFIILKH